MSRRRTLARSGLCVQEDLADWFHVLTAPSEYADEAAFMLDAVLIHDAGMYMTSGADGWLRRASAGRSPACRPALAGRADSGRH